uniref:WRKY transcription factor 58 n=1 Tax=Santalum album TaxID=35974 RepID=A0A650C2Z6_SANAL|nr:WRKY transcription factor 58 [Santalum album]
MDNDWDLMAVVRSCAATAEAATTTSSTTLSGDGGGSGGEPFVPSIVEAQENDPFQLWDLTADSKREEINPFKELEEIYKPFFPRVEAGVSQQAETVSLPQTNSSISEFGECINEQQQEQHEQQQQQRQRLPVCVHRGYVHQPQPQQQLLIPLYGNISYYLSPFAFYSDQLSGGPRSRKRSKSQKRRMVTHATGQRLAADMWAWRKYGQKPIKGSQYPRNYFRCSTWKGCTARKQVERSPLDPNMFIVAYTGHHSHPLPGPGTTLASSSGPLKISPAAASMKPSSSDPEATALNPPASTCRPRSPASTSMPPATKLEPKT